MSTELKQAPRIVTVEERTVALAARVVEHRGRATILVTNDHHEFLGYWPLPRTFSAEHAELLALQQALRFAANRGVRVVFSRSFPVVAWVAGATEPLDQPRYIHALVDEARELIPAAGVEVRLWRERSI